mmetsp:Transcript_13998/g.16112  ORF Transcript_13998/g.16112 Transcript_13998/m.16112 type:complete len:218 (-) Transcript_13998:354-1007(-)|eukprot:CAMPEP_0194390698 /NCGR_PEP_ID=MMETSP0174-20130528/111575_1 /TAXON_ID=216777 /ORGANISM="Proboscia alata, Strain PI-D3" /LENGTH=217 /DNA_ID=CAMNT_0039184329 /DNA_START=42 /DNA_END=695 /DNA_ORIENTATION=-
MAELLTKCRSLAALLFFLSSSNILLTSISFQSEALAFNTILPTHQIKSFKTPTRIGSLYLSSVDRSNDNKRRDDDQEQPPSIVDDILSDIHSNNFQHRIVVIGNGAILESTARLGPYFGSSVSPKTGDRMVTFASDDKSFEFHLKVDQVSKISFAEIDRTAPAEGGEQNSNTTMRICRFVNQDDGPMCSLILADSSTEAVAWFTGMIARYGNTVQIG